MGVKHDSFEFAIWRLCGLSILVTREAVPSEYGGPGSWEWSRWRLASFGEAWWANAKLRELNG